MHKRIGTTAIAAVLATGALGLAAAEAHPQKASHVTTKVKIRYKAPVNEYSPDTGFTGTVKAKKGCNAKRTVKLSKYGKTKSSKKGAFAFGVSPTGANPGKYTVKVLSDKRDDVICDAAKATLTVK
jgi:hypothetical protein